MKDITTLDALEDAIAFYAARGGDVGAMYVDRLSRLRNVASVDEILTPHQRIILHALCDTARQDAITQNSTLNPSVAAQPDSH